MAHPALVNKPHPLPSILHSLPKMGIAGLATYTFFAARASYPGVAYIRPSAPSILPPVYDYREVGGAVAVQRLCGFVG